jgi:hypothetical protein
MIGITYHNKTYAVEKPQEWAYIHACIHTYIHTYIRTYILHTHIHTKSAWPVAELKSSPSMLVLLSRRPTKNSYCFLWRQGNFLISYIDKVCPVAHRIGYWKLRPSMYWCHRSVNEWGFAICSVPRWPRDHDTMAQRNHYFHEWD